MKKKDSWHCISSTVMPLTCGEFTSETPRRLLRDAHEEQEARRDR